jgi:chitin disaccharide deacetylase
VRRLIVNADDFGLTRGVNDGIVEAHTHGVVTSTSLMVDAPAVRDAVRLGGEHPGLSVGLHFVDDSPALDDPAHAARAFAAQLERFRELTGSEPTHVDSHHHVHFERMATFAALVEPLGVPLRGYGRVRYIGAYYGGPRLDAAYLLGLLADEATGEASELGCHPARVTPDLRSSYLREREVELATLTEPGLRERIEALGLSLASYRDGRADS